MKAHLEIIIFVSVGDAVNLQLSIKAIEDMLIADDMSDNSNQTGN